MKYYIVPRKLDQTNIYVGSKQYGCLFAGELITESECRKRHITAPIKNRLILISIPSKETFWSFGVRYPAQEAILHMFRDLYVDSEWRREKGMD